MQCTIGLHWDGTRPYSSPPAAIFVASLRVVRHRVFSINSGLLHPVCLDRTSSPRAVFQDRYREVAPRVGLGAHAQRRSPAAAGHSPIFVQGIYRRSLTLHGTVRDLTLVNQSLRAQHQPMGFLPDSATILGGSRFAVCLAHGAQFLALTPPEVAQIA